MASASASLFTLAALLKLTTAIRRKVLMLAKKVVKDEEEEGGRGRLPTSREALKLTGELEDGWHLYKAVPGCSYTTSHFWSTRDTLFQQLTTTTFPFSIPKFRTHLILVDLRSTQRSFVSPALPHSRILLPS